jgi:hypothetical protein
MELFLHFIKLPLDYFDDLILSVLLIHLFVQTLTEVTNEILLLTDQFILLCHLSDVVLGINPELAIRSLALLQSILTSFQVSLK